MVSPTIAHLALLVGLLSSLAVTKLCLIDSAERDVLAQININSPFRCKFSFRHGGKHEVFICISTKMFLVALLPQRKNDCLFEPREKSGEVSLYWAQKYS